MFTDVTAAQQDLIVCDYPSRGQCDLASPGLSWLCPGLWSPRHPARRNIASHTPARQSPLVLLR